MNALPARAPEPERRDYALPEEIAARSRDPFDPGSVRKEVLSRLADALAADEPCEKIFKHANPEYRYKTLLAPHLAPGMVNMVLMQAMGEMAPLPESMFPGEELPSPYERERTAAEKADGFDAWRLVTEFAVSKHPNAPVEALERLTAAKPAGAANEQARKTAERRLADESFRAEWEHVEANAEAGSQVFADLLLVSLKYPGPSCAAAKTLAERPDRLAMMIDMRGQDFGPKIVGKILAHYPPAASAIFRMILTRFPQDAVMMAALAESPMLPVTLAAHLAKNPRTKTEALEKLAKNDDPDVRAWAQQALENRKKNGDVSTERIPKATPAVKAALHGTAAAEVLGVKTAALRVHSGIAAAVKESSSVIDVQRMAEEAVAKKIETERRIKGDSKPAPSVTDRDAAHFSRTADDEYAPGAAPVAANEPVRDIDELTKLHAKAGTPMEQTALAREVLEIQTKGLTSRSRKAVGSPAAAAPTVVTERPGVGDSSGAERAAAEEWPGLRIAAETVAAGGVKPDPLPNEGGAPQSPDMSVRIVKSEKIVRGGGAVDKAAPGA